MTWGQYGWSEMELMLDLMKKKKKKKKKKNDKVITRWNTG